MPQYRNNLPQLAGKAFLTDGGLETTMIFHKGIDLPCFAAFDLLAEPKGVSALLEYYEHYAGLARDYQLGFVFESVTWRAGPDWLQRAGYPLDALEPLCRDSVELLLPLREKYETQYSPIVISGQLGPRGDGYAVEGAMSSQQARDYHLRQAQALAQTEADMLSALTLNYSAEASGIALAAEAVGMPCVIAFTVETDGRLPSGQPLREAIEEVDATTASYPAYYMINCAHTSHFTHILEDAPWFRRVRALRANASCLSHAELDNSTTLDDGDPELFGREHRNLCEQYPHITILGGCCGTDTRHVRAVAEQLSALP